MTVLYETGIPDGMVARIQSFLRCTQPFFPDDAIRMGGGTILQARWRHRESTDIDLFCSSPVYLDAVRSSRLGMEQKLHEICDDRERTFVDGIASFAEIQGTEITLLPADTPVGERTRRFVPGTNVETWSTADILAAKLLYRLCQAGNAQPRDLYDLAAASHHDPEALHQAVGILTPRQHRQVRSLLMILPDDWAAASEKPLLGLSPEPYAADPQTIADLLVEFAHPAPETAGTHDPS